MSQPRVADPIRSGSTDSGVDSGSAIGHNIRADALFSLVPASLATAVRGPLAAALVTALALAQSTDGPGGKFADPRNITFHALHDAATRHWYQLEQERRILSDDATPAWINVQEALWIGPDKATEPTFKLEFRGVSGTSVTLVQRQRMQSLYANQAGYLYLFAGFRVEDPEVAVRNYTIHDLGGGQRAERPVRRVAVLPIDPLRSAWLLEVDVECGYPLYQAEYSFDGRVVSAIEVTRFRIGRHGAPDPSTWWRPRLRVSVFRTVAEALQTLPAARFVFPDANALPPGHELHSVRTVSDDLNRQVSLTLIYSDGIEELSVVQTLNAPAPPIPAAPPGGGNAYAVLTYRDVNVSQFLFHVNGVQVHVLGRGAQIRLEPLTTALLRQAVQ